MKDTPSLSYKHTVASALGKLGKLGKPTNKARGCWVHSDLMLAGTTGQTLGLVHQQWWLRPDRAQDADEKKVAGGRLRQSACEACLVRR